MNLPRERLLSKPLLQRECQLSSHQYLQTRPLSATARHTEARTR